ncbi:MAG TPA: arginine repressor [Syntrophomonadaceae bacterium]|jgi:transcriptional regulator of arginine metabolism|nr:arginine repressor [Syntrophomonadaceae bacterium]HRX20149.1 arginine repressor [Syntrophomonadaceae bacterium]
MKTQRQSAIVDILNKGRIKTQEELCEALKNRGFNVTQATVSRDIKEMQLHRIADHEGYHYTMPVSQPTRGINERRRRMFQDLVAHIDYSENIIVLKTVTGAAQSVASLIDSLGNEQILGTVAGDDTILVIVKQKKMVQKVLQEFRSLISK